MTLAVALCRQVLQSSLFAAPITGLDLIGSDVFCETLESGQPACEPQPYHISQPHLGQSAEPFRFFLPYLQSKEGKVSLTGLWALL